MITKKLKILIIGGSIGILLFGTIFFVITSTSSNSFKEEKGISKQNENFNKETGYQTGINPKKEITSKKNTDLTILLPGRFYNTGFIELAKIIKEKHNLTLHYKKIENMEFFKQIIQRKVLITGIDLYLVPSDWVLGYPGKSINTQENINPYVHPLFKNYTDKILPFALDPLVVLIPENTEFFYEDNVTLQDIANFILKENKVNKIQLPILRGIDKNDNKILKENKESFTNYFIITYNILKQVYEKENENDYNIIIDTINNPLLSKRSYTNFKITYQKLLSKNTNCIKFPDICILAYNLGKIKFGFLSDVDIKDKYFGNTGAKTVDINIYNFPIIAKEYQIRGRGFVVDPESINDEAISIFAEEYMNASIKNNISLRENVLSAFNNIYNIQKIKNKYGLILKFEPQFSLMLHSTTLQEDFLQKTNIIQKIIEKKPAWGIGGFFDPLDWNR